MTTDRGERGMEFYLTAIDADEAMRKFATAIALVLDGKMLEKNGVILKREQGELSNFPPVDRITLSFDIVPDIPGLDS